MYVGLFIKTEVDTSNWPTSILKKDTKQLAFPGSEGNAIRNFTH